MFSFASHPTSTRLNRVDCRIGFFSIVQHLQFHYFKIASAAAAATESLLAAQREMNSCESKAVVSSIMRNDFAVHFWKAFFECRHGDGERSSKAGRICEIIVVCAWLWMSAKENVELSLTWIKMSSAPRSSCARNIFIFQQSNPFKYSSFYCKQKLWKEGGRRRRNVKWNRTKRNLRESAPRNAWLKHDGWEIESGREKLLSKFVTQ
jgi:hypothetical protein